MTMEVKILKKENCPKYVINHSEAVYIKAMEIATNFDNVDLDIIKKGALLHDIGRSRTNGITHAIEGVQIAKDYGYTEKVLNVIERHIGAGISEKESEEIGLPKKSYIPITLEEKIVAHSDNLINGTDEVNIDFVIHKWKNRIKNPEENIQRLIILNKELVEPFKKEKKIK